MNHTPLFLLLPVLLLPACSPEEQGQKAPSEIAVSPALTDSARQMPQAIDLSTLQYEGEAVVLSWKMLSDVTFEDEYNEEVQAYVPYPTFGDTLRAVEGKQIMISGYVIPLEETGDETILVLSAQPYSSCFFCGGAGPESVMDIKLRNPGERKFTTDEQLRFRGRLRLNDSDLYYLNYILEDAELVN